tara:strand:+ start:56 stop:520 length:465 start_codon:yes stop_codon:yes gene_type:complete
MIIKPKDYCAAPDELAKNPNAFPRMQRIANGNEEALHFMWIFWNFTHCYDDLVDRDKPVSQDAAVRALADMFTELTYNQFWLRNSIALHAFFIQALNRWIAGDAAEKQGSPLAPAIRCGDVDLYMHVAFLCGGYDHMISVSDVRIYDPSPTDKK